MNGLTSKPLVALAMTIIVSSCAAPPPAPVRDLSRPRDAVEVYRIVRPGDTLYSLSWAAGVDYRELAAWNGLAAPYVIRPGQRISLVPTGRRAATPSASAPAEARASALPRDSGTGARAVTTAPASTPAAASPTPARPAAEPAPAPAQRAPVVTAPEKRPAAIQSAPGRWLWPVRGRIVADYAATRGLDIAVASGTPVKSAAAGQVVYAGSGLRGYGQLVIVKHSNEYLSAYGHNRKLLVQEGDSIVSGQVIAESGSAPGKGEQVHFEIRRNGQPVDPAGLLPAQS